MGAAGSPAGSLVGMTCGSGQQKFLHAATMHRHRRAPAGPEGTPRRFPSPRSSCQKSPEFAEGCVLPLVVFLPCLEKGFEVPRGAQ